MHARLSALGAIFLFACGPAAGAGGPARPQSNSASESTAERVDEPSPNARSEAEERPVEGAAGPCRDFRFEHGEVAAGDAEGMTDQRPVRVDHGSVTVTFHYACHGDSESVELEPLGAECGGADCLAEVRIGPNGEGSGEGQARIRAESPEGTAASYSLATTSTPGWLAFTHFYVVIDDGGFRVLRRHDDDDEAREVFEHRFEPGD